MQGPRGTLEGDPIALNDEIAIVPVLVWTASDAIDGTTIVHAEPTRLVVARPDGVRSIAVGKHRAGSEYPGPLTADPSELMDEDLRAAVLASAVRLDSTGTRDAEPDPSAEGPRVIISRVVLAVSLNSTRTSDVSPVCQVALADDGDLALLAL